MSVQVMNRVHQVMSRIHRDIGEDAAQQLRPLRGALPGAPRGSWHARVLVQRHGPTMLTNSIEQLLVTKTAEFDELYPRF